jgi:mycothiol system anti-sigma-R factor
VKDECNDLLQELDHLLHGELHGERAEALRHHLNDCPPCFESADFQAQLKLMIAKKCHEEVPDSLRQKVLGFLQDGAPS